MRITKMLEKSALYFLTGSLMMALSGCGSSETTGSPEASSTEEIIEKETENLNYIADGIVLPEHFENMIYPMEAIMVGEYSQGLPYYEDGDEADAFWFPMAVLSSIMTDNGAIETEFSDGYCLYNKEQINQFASTLFYAFDHESLPTFETEKPEVYAFYDDEKEKFGLLCGNIGDLGIQVMNCYKEMDHYQLEVDLLRNTTKDIVSQYLISVYPQKDSKDSGLFAYSVASCEQMESTVADDSDEEFEGEDAPSNEGDYDLVDGEELVDNSQIDDSEIIIDKEEALDLAKAYMGEDYTYSFRGKVTIGDYDYYDFAIREKESKDVLVCINGLDVVSGRHNKDGSWSFDQ